MPRSKIPDDKVSGAAENNSRLLEILEPKPLLVARAFALPLVGIID